MRVFVRVYSSAEKVKDSASKQMYVFQSSGCDSFFTQPVGRKVKHLFRAGFRLGCACVLSLVDVGAPTKVSSAELFVDASANLPAPMPLEEGWGRMTSVGSVSRA